MTEKLSRNIIAEHAQILRKQYRIKILTIVATETDTLFFHRFNDKDSIRLEYKRCQMERD